ncbi:MAG: 4Fe-4S dicluster domain-containing protein, partial [Candidatus Omnitrophica bacterium]|nr:4Fe-4S dicluster domain-containing protein [Candidatus Omnitrophota bacterium]
PKLIVTLAKKLIKYYPCVERDNCIRCAACIKACPNKIISMTKKGIIFDYKKCIACFCCQEVCPNAAIKVKKSFLAKMIGL